MGNKYIIELEDKPFHNEDGDSLCRVKGFNSLVFDMTGISKLAHYHEPDLEQVRKEAYQKGYVDAKCGYENGFENGMIVAWEAARKISSMNSFTRDEIFGLVITSNILDENTAAEVIEKLKAYEQKQKREEEQIQVGDEVRNIENRWTAVVCNIDRECMTLMDTNGALGDGYNVNRFTKTGRYFPEIAEVLEKMRGEQDG